MQVANLLRPGGYTQLVSNTLGTDPVCILRSELGTELEFVIMVIAVSCV